jgi:hypothetical protein
VYDGEGVMLDAATLCWIVRLPDKRLDAVVANEAGGCPTCKDAEARAFLGRLQRLGKSE